MTLPRLKARLALSAERLTEAHAKLDAVKARTNGTPVEDPKMGGAAGRFPLSRYESASGTN